MTDRDVPAEVIHARVLNTRVDPPAPDPEIDPHAISTFRCLRCGFTLSSADSTAEELAAAHDCQRRTFRASAKSVKAPG